MNFIKAVKRRGHGKDIQKSKYAILTVTRLWAGRQRNGGPITLFQTVEGILFSDREDDYIWFTVFNSTIVYHHNGINKVKIVFSSPSYRPERLWFPPLATYRTVPGGSRFGRKPVEVKQSVLVKNA